MLYSVFMLALRSIRRNLLRSFLTILGIVIGVSAVITMVTLGNGATAVDQGADRRPGHQSADGAPGPAHGAGRRWRHQQRAAIQGRRCRSHCREIGGIAAVAPEGRASVTVVANGRNWSTSVIGSSNAWFDTGNWKLASGRIFEADEQLAGRPCASSARRCGAKSSTARPARPASASNCACASSPAPSSASSPPKGQSGMGDQDDTVVVPLHTLQRRVTGSLKVATLLVSMQDGSDSAPLKASLRELLRERRNLAEGDDDNFNIFDTQQLAETLSSTTEVLTTLLGAVAAVSLLVGGIGIMNIMLVSVTERTREIGLRLAIGALEHEVLLQFLIEAVVLSALGGVIGILIATAASWGLSSLMGVPYVFDPFINLLSLAFSAGIGVLFGYFPARRAARMDPIEALRHE
jgi:putative ABC transport system permease protein